MHNAHENTLREILILKERFHVNDDDPIFLFLQSYGKLQDKMIEAIRDVDEQDKIISLRYQQLVESMEVFEKLNEKIRTDAVKIPKLFLDEINSVQSEILNLKSHIESLYVDNKNYSNSIRSLARNSYQFSNSMKMIQSKHWLLFIGIGSNILLLIIVLLILLIKVH